MRILMDFKGEASEPAWFAVNDGVMGGRSRGGPSLVNGRLHFAGTLSLENNGGFSSVRARCSGAELAGAEVVVLRVCGDGRTYQLRFATDARLRGMRVSYGASFPTQAGQWEDLRLPLAGLRPKARGTLLDGPQFDASQVREIGLLIGDGQGGEFALAVEWIGVE